MFLIPGKMPNNCAIDCPCWQEYAICECQLGAIGEENDDPVIGRLKDCPLQEAPTMEMAINGMAKAIMALAESVTDGKSGLDIFLDELKSKIDIQKMNREKE